ncbi:MAG: translocation/assembly module TamB domain-containing protein, partial [Burkholderiales bacterium]
RTAERARLTATGTLPLDPARPAQLDFRAERLALPISPEQRLVVSGDGSLALREGRVDLGVRARADEALIRLLGKSRPSVSEDVVVQHAAGVEPPPAARTGAPVLPFSARIEVDLGDRFRVSGEGISARLAGRLELEASGVGTLLAHGDVRIVEGRYTQLGTTLIIEHGLLRFSGPIDNPGLDILATRENLPVRVWAQISGTAQDPAITLGSDEPMTDAQRLAWLTLGAPLDEDPGAAQSAALQAAARALIGSVTGAGEGESLAQTLGVDVLAVRSDVTGASFLTVGKRLSERLFVSYEQGLQGVWNIVRVQLQLSRRLQLNMQAGSESAVDLMLTVPFN